jgi:hypothetical protein
MNLNSIISAIPNKAKRTGISKPRAKKSQDFDIRVVEGDCTVSDELFKSLNLQNRSATIAHVDGKLLMVIFAAGSAEAEKAIFKARKDGKEKSATVRLSYFAQAFEEAIVATGVAEKIDATYSTTDVTAELEDADTQEGITVLQLTYVAPTERKKRTKEEGAETADVVADATSEDAPAENESEVVSASEIPSEF